MLQARHSDYPCRCLCPTSYAMVDTQGTFTALSIFNFAQTSIREKRSKAIATGVWADDCLNGMMVHAIAVAWAQGE